MNGNKLSNDIFNDNATVECGEVKETPYQTYAKMRAGVQTQFIIKYNDAVFPMRILSEAETQQCLINAKVMMSAKSSHVRNDPLSEYREYMCWVLSRALTPVPVANDPFLNEAIEKPSEIVTHTSRNVRELKEVLSREGISGLFSLYAEREAELNPNLNTMTQEQLDHFEEDLKKKYMEEGADAAMELLSKCTSPKLRLIVLNFLENSIQLQDKLHTLISQN